MNIERQKEKVGFFHYDTRNFDFESSNGTPETRINVQLHIIENPRNIEETDSAVQVNFSALIVLDTYVLSSSLTQVNVIKDQKVESQEDLTQEDMQELAAPLFDLLKRMTYELTEVALDEPGLKLEF